MSTKSSYAAMYGRAQAAISRKTSPKSSPGKDKPTQKKDELSARRAGANEDPFSHINVSLRIRPRHDNRSCSYRLVDNSNLIEFNVRQKHEKSKFVGLGDQRRTGSKRFLFSCPTIFPEDATQAKVFEETSLPVIKKALEGVNGTIFTYGQTGSGKTYTLTGGGTYQERGIIPRSIETYFQTVRAKERSNHKIQCTVSYVEIYNEHIYDLLNPENKGKKLENWAELKLRENSGDNSSSSKAASTHANNGSSFEVVGLQEVIVQSEEEAINLLFMGNVNRVTSETPMNNASSRSHCIFTLKLEDHNLTSGKICYSTLRLVDLAGSERLFRRNNNTVTRTEGRYINLSLHYLEQVIYKLSTKSTGFVSFRNSKLTALVSDTLGGNSNTTFIATINPEDEFGLESISTCKFVHRCSLVKQSATKREVEDLPTRVLRLQRENGQLRGQLRSAGGTVPTSSEHGTIGSQDPAHVTNRLRQILNDDEAKQFVDSHVTDLQFAKQCLLQLRKIGVGAPYNSAEVRQTHAAKLPVTPPLTPRLRHDTVPVSSDALPRPHPSPRPSSRQSGLRSSQGKSRDLYAATSPIRGATAAYNASILLSAQDRQNQSYFGAQPNNTAYFLRSPQKVPDSQQVAPDSPRIDVNSTSELVDEDTGLSVNEILRAGQIFEMHEADGRNPATMIWCSQDLRTLLWRRVNEETVCGALPMSEIVEIHIEDDGNNSEKRFSIKTHLSNVQLASISKAGNLVSSAEDCQAYCRALQQLTGLNQRR